MEFVFSWKHKLAMVSQTRVCVYLSNSGFLRLPFWPFPTHTHDECHYKACTDICVWPRSVTANVLARRWFHSLTRLFCFSQPTTEELVKQWPTSWPKSWRRETNRNPAKPPGKRWRGLNWEAQTRWKIYWTLLWLSPVRHPGHTVGFFVFFFCCFF